MTRAKLVEIHDSPDPTRNRRGAHSRCGAFPGSWLLSEGVYTQACALAEVLRVRESGMVGEGRLPSVASLTKGPRGSRSGFGCPGTRPPFWAEQLGGK